MTTRYFPPSWIAIPVRRIVISRNRTGKFFLHTKAHRGGYGRKYKSRAGYVRKHEHVIVLWKWQYNLHPLFFLYMDGRKSSFLRIRGKIVA